MALLTAAVRAATAEDAPFLKRVFLDVRREDLPGLTPEQIDPLLAMQYRSHTADRRARYPHAETSVITLDGEPVGTVCVDRDRGRVHLVDIAVLKEHRRRGLASQVIADLLRGSERATLSVWGQNTGARRLYERHGFQVVSEQFGYLLMATEADG